MQDYDVIIIGAGAAGLFCAIECGKRGQSVCIIDHAKKIGEKIRISGGGRCNFTNIYASPENYISHNQHFCKSALSRYTQYDFIDYITAHGIAHHEKKLGQLFCDHSATDIIDALITDCETHGVTIKTATSIDGVQKTDGHFTLATSVGKLSSHSLVVACGGLSIPKIGATGFGYDIARQFGHDITPTRAGLVPLTFTSAVLDFCKNLSGLSVEARVYTHDKKTSFAEGLLFTHRGLSGPSILQISSYWTEGEAIIIDLLPTHNIADILTEARTQTPKQDITTIIGNYLPKRLAQSICDMMSIHGHVGELSNTAIQTLSNHINQWSVKPNGTEGYRTAEVTLGGINTNELSSKTMESKLCNNLYFIGEVIDVTGQLGGFNFQWAWSSGWACGQVA